MDQVANGSNEQEAIQAAIKRAHMQQLWILVLHKLNISLMHLMKQDSVLHTGNVKNIFFVKNYTLISFLKKIKYQYV